MTDARYPDRWLTDRRILRLSDAAHRLFVVALTWSVSNRTDGALDDDDLALLQRVDPSRAVELEAAGLWQRTSSGWLIVGFATTQTTAAQLDAAAHARAQARDRKARERTRKRTGQQGVTRDVPRDDTGQARTGQDRQGQEVPAPGFESETTDVSTDLSTDVTADYDDAHWRHLAADHELLDAERERQMQW